MQNIKVEILMGLPGSGKSTFAEKRCKLIKNSEILSIDEIIDNVYPFNRKNKTMSDYIKIGLHNVKRQTETIIVDGLFLTNEHVYTALLAISDIFDEINVTIHFLEEDRETCVKNDGGRRDKPSTNTILYSEYETPDIESLNKRLIDFNTKILDVINHKVELKEDWYRFTIQNVGYTKDGILRSYRWCTGGAHGNCWDSSMSPISADTPAQFTALDDFLLKVAPNTTFIQYKRIQEECIYIEETSESEYYGGYSNYNNWACDLKKLYNLLEEMNLV